MSKKPLCLTLLTLVMLAPGVASAGQMGAKDEPDVSGPLSLEQRQCAGKTETVDQAAAAAAKSCLYFFSFDPAAETDALRDYGIVWLQATFNAAPGWCATKVNSDISVPAEAEVHTRAPDERIKVRRRKRIRTELVGGADGTASENGSVSQSYLLYPRRIVPLTRQDGALLRLNWEGNSSKKLAFVSGAEVSWDAQEEAPTGFAFEVRYELQHGGC